MLTFTDNSLAAPFHRKYSNYELSRFAVDMAKRCNVPEDQRNIAPRVAIVLARDNEIVGWAAKGIGGAYRDDQSLIEFTVSPEEHAEKALIDRLKRDLTEGATAFVTLEPCTKRKKGVSCAELLISRGIVTVHIANCDPNPTIGALAWKLFLKNGIKVLDFPPELRNEARRDNYKFFEKFHCSRACRGKTTFDFEINGGLKLLGPVGKEFQTRWTERCDQSIYAIDSDFDVCLAKNCWEFNQVDDPSRWLEDSYFTKPVQVGQIVIFQNNFGFALVKVLRAKRSTHQANSELKIEFELRYRQLNN